MDLISTHDFSFSYPAELSGHSGAEPISGHKESGAAGSLGKSESSKVLTNVNLSIAEGSFNVLLGANGSGKTTLLQQLHPALAVHGERSGSIEWRGQIVSRETAAEVGEHIGFVMQRPESQMVTDKVWHELAFGLENLGLPGAEIRRKVAEIATYFGIQQWFDSDVSELSGGQKQILNLASAMVMDPELLILDEPTAQLDPIAAENFAQMLHRLNYELGVTILVAEHDVQRILPYATQVLLIEHGSIAVAGTVPQALTAIMRDYPRMVEALPIPTQIYSAVRSDISQLSAGSDSLPLTVGEGKAWLGSLMGGSAAVEQTHAASDAVKESQTAERTEKQTIVARDLWFRYSQSDPDLLKGLNLSVNHSEIFALVGANGAGKSTLVSVLSGINKPYRGSVALDGKKIEKFAPGELYRSYVGVLPQDPQTLFVGKTVFADLAQVLEGPHRSFGRHNHTDDETRLLIEQGAESLGIGDLLGRNPYDLSGGEQQLAALLKVILLRPQILLLDEPTKAMDDSAKAHAATLLKQLSAQGVTTLMVTHDVEFAAQAADQAGMFFDGQVVSEEPVHEFFSTNSFYTTASSRIAREWFPLAITKQEVVECVRKSKTS